MKFKILDLKVQHKKLNIVRSVLIDIDIILFCHVSLVLVKFIAIHLVKSTFLYSLDTKSSFILVGSFFL